MSDAELVRYLDGELSAGARAALEALLARTPERARRLATLRRRSTRFAALLANVDPTEADVRRSALTIRNDALPAGRPAQHTPAMRRALAAWARSPVTMRAAATIALLLGFTFAVPPVRAWIVEQARSVALTLGLIEPPPALPPADMAAPPAGAAVTYSFAVAADTFDIVAPQTIGTLVVRRGAGAMGMAQQPPAGVASFVLTPPRTLRIEGAGADDAIFELSLPAAVQAIRVRTGAQPDRILAMPGPGAELRVPLTTR